MSSNILLRSAAAARLSICARQYFLVRSAATLSICARPSIAGRYTRCYGTGSIHDNDPKLLEEEKQRNLAGRQHKTSAPHENAPGWNEYLASTSEANVKADRSEGTTETMTKSTIERIKNRHHAEESTVGVKAEYEKDEVEGPLKGAAGKARDDDNAEVEPTQPTPSEEVVRAEHEDFGVPLEDADIAEGEPTPSEEVVRAEHELYEKDEVEGPLKGAVGKARDDDTAEDEPMQPTPSEGVVRAEHEVLEVPSKGAPGKASDNDTAEEEPTPSEEVVRAELGVTFGKA